MQNQPDGEERQRWTGQLEFLFSCMAVSVGLGNVWRFPFTAYENGGGAFLIPYVIVLFFVGKPMYFMEAAMGQFSGQAAVKMWSLCPSFLGVSIGQAFGTTAVLTYYAALLALAVYYLAVSCQKVLPWVHCRPQWAHCIDADTMAPNVTKSTQSSSELYFLREVLKEKDTIEDGIGNPSIELMGALFITWLITFCVLIRGIHSLGKASYFMALFPYVMLLALLVRAVTLDGAVDGIIYFLKPQWKELLNMKVWKAACTQCFFSLSVGFLPIMTFSSHNHFHHKVQRDTMIVTTMDTLTSLIAGITIFGMLGNLSKNLNAKDISEVVRSGTSLAFISYPDAIAKFDAAQHLFAIMFFIMLFVLGVGSLMALTNGVLTIVRDHYKIKRYWILAAILAFICFVIGSTYLTPGGQWILNLVDYYAGTYCIFFLAVFEVIGITWFYGLRNFCDDIEFMLRKKLSIYWRVCWVIITPGILIWVFTYSMIITEPLEYSGSRYPLVADIAGWIMFIFGCIQFPAWAWWYCCTHKEDTCAKTLKRGVTATDEWGPSDPAMKAEWIAYKKQLEQQRAEERQSRNITEFRQKFYYIFGFSK